MVRVPPRIQNQVTLNPSTPPTPAYPSLSFAQEAGGGEEVVVVVVVSSQ